MESIKEKITELQAERDRLQQSLVGHFYDLLFSVRTRRAMQQIDAELDVLYTQLAALED